MGRRCGLYFALLLATSMTLGGCAATDSEGDDGEAASDEAEISAAGASLVGSYGGGQTFRSLVLSAAPAGSANRFSADVGAGSQVHLEGTFTAGEKTITLTSPDASAAAAKHLGRYRYTKNADALVLSRSGFQDTITKIVPGPLATCATGVFTRGFADEVRRTVAPVPGNTDNQAAPRFKRKVSAFSGRTWKRGADGAWKSSPAILNGYRGELYLGDEHAGAFEVVVHAKTQSTVTASSAAGELYRFVYYQGAFHARPDTAEVAAPIVLEGKLSESPWGNFGSPPSPLTFRGPARFTDHCFSMLDAPVTETTTEVREAFATF